MKTFGLLVVMAAAFAVVYPIATSAQVSWYPIGDPMNEPHVQELGAWAVAEHVKQAHDGLKFNKVVSGEEQSDAGVKYHLVIEALNSGGKQGRYEAILIEEDLSEWALAAHTKVYNDGLRFSKVLYGEVQIVSVVSYRLDVGALRLDGKDAMYTAEVFEQDWPTIAARKLVSFDPAS
ncbi:hypothetical protein ACQ4PT_071947 [Festuca glaucescens]